MGTSDHDRLVRLEERLAALAQLNDERDRLLVQRFEIEAAALTRNLEGLREEYKAGHETIVERVDNLAGIVAAQTGTTSGTMRIFLVGAVAISLMGLVVTIVHMTT